MRAFALALVAALSASQPVPLPDTSDVWLRLCGSASSQVVVDAWVDLLCPDCAGEWSTLLALAKNYSPAQLALNMHVFPLPYHTWAFSTANAARIIASLNASDSARFAWMDYMFAGANPGQLQFYNDALAGNSTEEVQALLAATAARAALTVGGGLRANRWRAARACHAERVAASEEVCYICYMWYVVCNVYMLAFVMMGAS